jgi:hypothetical protein
MAGSGRSTTIFRFKTGTGGADETSAPPVRITPTLQAAACSLVSGCNRVR